MTYNHEDYGQGVTTYMERGEHGVRFVVLKEDTTVWSKIVPYIRSKSGAAVMKAAAQEQFTVARRLSDEG